LTRRARTFSGDEMKRLLDAAKGGSYGRRNYLMLLMAYRNGLRVSELIDLRFKDIDLDTSRLYVRRKKGSLSAHEPIVKYVPLKQSDAYRSCIVAPHPWCDMR
jgi:integrase